MRFGLEKQCRAQIPDQHSLGSFVVEKSDGSTAQEAQVTSLASCSETAGDKGISSAGEAFGYPQSLSGAPVGGQSWDLGLGGGVQLGMFRFTGKTLDSARARVPVSP